MLFDVLPSHGRERGVPPPAASTSGARARAGPSAFARWGPEAGVAAVPRRVVGRQMRHEKSARGVGGQTAAPGWVGGRTVARGGRTGCYSNLYRRFVGGNTTATPQTSLVPARAQMYVVAGGMGPCGGMERN